MRLSSWRLSLNARSLRFSSRGDLPASLRSLALSHVCPWKCCFPFRKVAFNRLWFLFAIIVFVSLYVARLSFRWNRSEPPVEPA